MRIGVGRVDSRPCVRCCADVQLAVPAIAVRGEVGNAVRTCRTREKGSAWSCRASSWARGQQAEACPRRARKAASARAIRCPAIHVNVAVELYVAAQVRP